MWAIWYWPDNFAPLWPLDVGPDWIKFDLSVNVAPMFAFTKGTLVSYVRTISYWRYTPVKR